MQVQARSLRDFFLLSCRTNRQPPSFLLQIVLYSCARCVSALLPRASVPSSYPAKRPIPTDAKSFEIFAAVVWGSVMWLFENRRVNLNNGLVNSMDCEYRRLVAEEAAAGGKRERLADKQATPQLLLLIRSIRQCRALGWSAQLGLAQYLGHHLIH